jgi:hypothetical protein
MVDLMADDIMMIGWNDEDGDGGGFGRMPNADLLISLYLRI